MAPDTFAARTASYAPTTRASYTCAALCRRKSWSRAMGASARRSDDADKPGKIGA